MNTTVTPEADSFLAAIAAEPADDTTKLVYADWLDEHGRADEARLTRDLCRLRAGEVVEPWAAPAAVLRAVAGWFSPRGRTRIDELSPFERMLFPWFRAAWLAVGLAAAPCDRRACEAAVDLAYRAAGLPPPELKVWLSGPLHGAVGAALLAGSAGAQVWAQVRDQVRDQVRAQVGDQVGDQVRDQVGDQVRDQVWAQVWAQVGDQVRDQVGAQVWAQVGYGQHDAGWLAFYAYFSSVGLVAADRLAGLFALTACGWWWPFAGAVVLTERPTRFEMSDGKLVRIEYADGLTVDRRRT